MMDFLAAVAAIGLLVWWIVRRDQKRAAQMDEDTLAQRRRERVLRLVNEHREPRTHWWA